MKLSVIGTGYVGLVAGTCLADNGNEVTCVDRDERKVEQLLQGRVPIYEPGLTELVLRNAAAGRLHFTTDFQQAIPAAQLVLVTVGTPSDASGAADLAGVWEAIERSAEHLSPQAVVVLKSTVPVGTQAEAMRRLTALTGRACEVVSNPEFLREGAAINDFMFPDRVVIGTRNPAAADLLRELYAPLLRSGRPLLVMTPESAEMTKYVANAMLATKISFINEMAALCERLGCDINDVRQGIGHDHRIGFAVLFPGLGFGGSSMPKDLRALAAMARANGVEPRMLDAVQSVNERQVDVLLRRIETHFEGQLAGRTLGVWGLAYKPRTDDIRESPGLALIDRLLERGVVLRVHDPEAMNRVRDRYGDRLHYATQPLDALDGADGLAIVTDWGEFRSVDLIEMRRRLTAPVIFDGRNLYEPDQLRAAGFQYYCVGRAPTSPRESSRDDSHTSPSSQS